MRHWTRFLNSPALGGRESTLRRSIIRSPEDFHSAVFCHALYLLETSKRSGLSATFEQAR
ncbi:hypothetical protein GX48_06180 [Paracoccidioides brasiliensis]|nr:hypothetical protein GX48_06180 [Paracoccidioides brasiliensis]